MPLRLLPSTLAKLDQPGSQPYPLIIQELTGPKRTIILRGASLPEETLRVGVEQRAEVKHYPGNPVGTLQVMGPSFLPTTLTGRWEDHFLAQDENYAELINFPAVAPAGRAGSQRTGGASFQSGGAVPTGEARRARTLRDAMFKVCKSGMLVKLQWASIARYGIVKRFEPEHEREEDIRFELEFIWIGDTNAQPRPRLQARANRLGVLAKIAAAIEAALDAINTALALAYGGVAQVLNPFARLTGFVNDFLDASQQVAGLAFTPVETLGILRQQLTSIKLAARDTKLAIRQRNAAFSATIEGFGPKGVAEASTATYEAVRQLIIMGETADRGLSDVEELEIPAVLGFYLATGGETLRDVALRFYGDANSWQAIRDYNNLSTSILATGVTVIVPRLESTT